MENSNSAEKIKLWKEKFQDSLQKQVKTMMQADPALTESEAKDQWYLNRLATIMVGTEELGKRIINLEKQLEAGTK